MFAFYRDEMQATVCPSLTNILKQYVLCNVLGIVLCFFSDFIFILGLLSMKAYYVPQFWVVFGVAVVHFYLVGGEVPYFESSVYLCVFFGVCEFSWPLRVRHLVACLYRVVAAISISHR